MSIFFGSFGSSAPKSRIWALFRSPGLQTSGNCAGRLHKACGGLWTTKNLIIRDISRENRAQISVISTRRRLRRLRARAKVSFGPPKNMRKAGQHRLPGGQDCFRPGGSRLGSISDPRFESRVTLHMGMHILGGEQHGGKKCRRISSPDWELSREGTSERGASRRGAAFGRFPRKISLFCEFLRESRKTPSPAT